MTEDDDKRVFDYLGDMVGSEVMVMRKDNSCLTGTLQAFDKHLNLAMTDITITQSREDEVVIESNSQHIQRGDFVVDVQPAPVDKVDEIDRDGEPDV